MEIEGLTHSTRPHLNIKRSAILVNLTLLFEEDSNL